MAEIILDETDTVSTVMGEEYRGEFQMICEKYGSSAVKLEVRNSAQEDLTDFPWVTARFNEEDIEFTSAGDALDVVFTRGFEYRLRTDTAGAVVSIDRH